MATAVDTSKAQWDQIVAILKTEMASGRLNNCAWSDTKGIAHTTTMGDVQRSVDLYTGTLPACGVQLTDLQLGPEGAGRRLMKTTFAVLVSVKAADYTDGSGNLVIANGADALAQGYAFVSDGAGKGIAEIFRDQTNYTLGGTARIAKMTKVQPFVQIDRAEGTNGQVWADYYITLYCEALVNLF